jgi:hypothetical protein
VPDISVNYTVTKNCNNSEGVIVLETSGGIPPYTYNWDVGSDSSSASFTTAGEYNVTITDAKSNTHVETIQLYSDTYSEIYWTYDNNVLISMDTITCSANSTLWKSKAVSRNVTGTESVNFF